MNKFLLLIAILSTFVFSSSNVQPNFVIIYVDDMGYADIGKFQDEKISTPNLDVMAQMAKLGLISMQALLSVLQVELVF